MQYNIYTLFQLTKMQYKIYTLFQLTDNAVFNLPLFCDVLWFIFSWLTFPDNFLQAQQIQVPENRMLKL